MVNRDAPRSESILGLARELVGGAVGLARLEVQHARQEMAQSAGHVKRGSILFGVAAVLAVLALIAFVAFIILGLSALIGWPAWLVALIVLVVLLVLAGLVAYRGVRQLRQVQVKPNETIASVQEDIAWAKRLIRRE